MSEQRYGVGMSETREVPAGWYEVPGGGRRFWNGRMWTTDVVGGAESPRVEPSTGGEPQHAVEVVSGSMLNVVAIALAIAGFLMMFTAVQMLAPIVYGVLAVALVLGVYGVALKLPARSAGVVAIAISTLVLFIGVVVPAVSGDGFPA